MRSRGALVLGAALACAAPLAAQDGARDTAAARASERVDPRARTRVLEQRGGTATVVAGPTYRAGRLQERWLGDDWRDAWTAPAEVPVLDLDTFAGGLTPIEQGGGNQTYSLAFRGADGREYRFRSVNKEQGRGLPRDLKGTVVEWVLQDQVSSLHPGAGPVTDALEDAVGILHTSRRVFLMPDHPRLGEHRALFAGMLGTLEERPEEGAGSEDPWIAAAAEVEGGDFYEEFEKDARQRLDTRDYLRGRLVDLWLGDWDRHEDQYRWARRDSGGVRLWRAIPRDRDYAFVHYDGAALGVARGFLPKAVRFREDYDGQVFGLTQNAQFMDRRLLADLDRAAWEAEIRFVQSRLTDAVIEDAARRMPAAWYEATAGELTRFLRERRDRLPEAAWEFYGMLAIDAEVHGKDTPDLAVADRLPDGTLEVRIFAAGEAEPYFRRRYLPDETDEVRLFLHGGDDRAVVRGGGPADVGVRVVGGGGDDLLADSSAAGYTAFYDDRGENRFVRRRGTVVDERAYTPPAYTRGQGAVPPRDWGDGSSLFSPYGDWKPRVGLVVGGGPSWTRYGFRRFPHAARHDLRVLWAPELTRFGLEYQGDFVFTGSRRRLEVDARATELMGSDFQGFGNDVPEEDERDRYRVLERTLLLEPTWFFPLSRRSHWTIGPTLRWTDPRVPEGSRADLADPRGSRSFGALGVRLGAILEHRDAPAFPRRGWMLEAEAGGYGGGEALDGAWGSGRATAAAYLTPVDAGPTLALRAGAMGAAGEYPFQYAAFVGGGSSLRGHRGQRFLGDASVFGGAELRQVLTRAELIVKGDLGVLGLVDAGRVWHDGGSPGGWHTAVGAGVFFSFLDRSRTVAVTYAHGEVGRVYLDLGFAF